MSDEAMNDGVNPAEDAGELESSAPDREDQEEPEELEATDDQEPTDDQEGETDDQEETEEGLGYDPDSPGQYSPEEWAVIRKPAVTPADYALMDAMQKERLRKRREDVALNGWKTSKGAQLLQQLSDAYAEYHKYLRSQPEAQDLAQRFDDGLDRIYQRIRANLERAQMAPRCTQIKGNGQRCKAPKVKGKKFCHVHQAMADARPKDFAIPALDDASGIQIGIQRLAQGVADGTLDAKKATTLGYLLQLALSNVGRVDFEKDTAAEGE